jgi:hypothetical protein
MSERVPAPRRAVTRGALPYVDGDSGVVLSIGLNDPALYRFTMTADEARRLAGHLTDAAAAADRFISALNGDFT